MKSLLNATWYLLGIMFNVFLLVVAIFIAVNLTERAYNYGMQFAKDIATPKESREVEIILPEGATLSQVSNILEENGVVKSALFYRLEAIINGMDGGFKGGTYIVNANMDSIELGWALRTQASSDIVITIREGYTVSDIADYLDTNNIVSAEDFINACNQSEFNYAFLDHIPKRENRLEGYLFPDTYFIAPNSTPEQIINKMLTRFAEIFDDNCEYQARLMRRSMDDIITIASIIEKEMRNDEERSFASSVIYNRLAGADRRLEMTSTIQYALSKRKDRLTDEDFKIESPYNTYIYPGIPEGPICNPGQASIKAALEPESSNYLYFVLKDEETGEHEFMESYEEYVNAKQLYGQKF